MKRSQPAQRPTAVLVLAILNFVFGGMGLLGSIIGGLGLLLLWALADKFPTPPQGPNPFELVWTMYRSIGLEYMIVQMILGGIMAVLLIIAGIGLLRLRPWARWLCIGYSIVTILSTVANTVYAILVVNPAVSQSLAEFPEKMSGPKGAGAPPMPMMTPGMNTTLSIFGAIIGMTYAIVLLVVLFLPHVSAAFNQVRTTPEEEYFDSDTSR